MSLEAGVLSPDLSSFPHHYIILFEFLKLFVNHYIVAYIVFKNMNDLISKLDKFLKKFKHIYLKQ